MSSGCIKKLITETMAYVLTDIPFLNSQSPYFFKTNNIKLLKEKALKIIPEYGRKWVFMIGFNL